MSKNLKIDVERCKELFEYRDGKLIRKVRTANRVKVGDIAGSLNKSTGYSSRGNRWKIVQRLANRLRVASRRPWRKTN